MANKAKTRKSISKRFKITKTGKVLRRAIVQDHNLAKKTGKQRRLAKKWFTVSKIEVKQLKKSLYL